LPAQEQIDDENIALLGGQRQCALTRLCKSNANVNEKKMILIFAVLNVGVVVFLPLCDTRVTALSTINSTNYTKRIKLHLRDKKQTNLVSSSECRRKVVSGT
jgi:hypothetical protein